MTVLASRILDGFVQMYGSRDGDGSGETLWFYE